MSTLTKKAMVDAISKMMGQFGIPSVEFTDEHGKVHGRIEAQMPVSVRAKVRKIGGGFAFIKAGDKIARRLVSEGVCPERIGVIKQVTKDRGGVHVVMEDGCFFSAGGDGGWYREFEIIK